MTRLIVCGCLGRLGTAITKIAAEHPNFEIAAGVDVFDKSCPFPLFSGIDQCTMSADAIICVERPTNVDGLLAILNHSVKRQIPLVLCTTGLPPEVEAAVSKAAENTVILRSANMSLGINLLSGLLKKAAQLLYDADFDIEIIEKHHNQKLDAPSGTALLLADSIKENLSEKMQYVSDRSQSHEKRTRNEIGLHALRGGTIVGEHSVVFAGRDEVIELKHSAASRDVFAVGALKAAEFLQGKAAGIYTMSDLIIL
jgi:4-hydroxy-tetrahydrodipicolinate reductase